jgi:integrase
MTLSVTPDSDMGEASNRGAMPSKNPVNLAAVRDRAVAVLEGVSRRDLLSAFSFLERRLGVELQATPATAAAVRRVFETTKPVQLSLSGKRIANVRSLVARAVQEHGLKRPRRIGPIAPVWSSLLETFSHRNYRKCLSRLARYATENGIAPDDVRSQSLVGFEAALEAECSVKDPRAIVHHTIASWNMAMRLVQSWPRTRLTSPFRGEPDILPWSAFPVSFRVDVERWVERMSNPNPLDFDAPAQSLRSATIDSSRKSFRRFASALVRRGVLPASGVVGLSVFFEGPAFREGLKHFLRPGKAGGSTTTQHAHRLATQLYHVARHYVRLDAKRLEELDLTRKRLDPKIGKGMSRRNRDRLEQFDDPEVVQRLLAFPEAEAARARRLPTPARRAKGLERALAVALLIDTGLRLKNLRSIHLDQNVRRVHERVFVSFEVKNRLDLEFELPIETSALLDEFLTDGRPVLPGHDKSRYLFPGPGGEPRSESAMRNLVQRGVERRAGIVLNPHLFRHAIAKIVVERDPSLYVAVSRRLGHKSISTTLGAYLGTETRAASRQLNRVLSKARHDPGSEEA